VIGPDCDWNRPNCVVSWPDPGNRVSHPWQAKTRGTNHRLPLVNRAQLPAVASAECAQSDPKIGARHAAWGGGHFDLQNRCLIGQCCRKIGRPVAGDWHAGEPNAHFCFGFDRVDRGTCRLISVCSHGGRGENGQARQGSENGRGRHAARAVFAIFNRRTTPTISWRRKDLGDDRSDCLHWR
jgi:hypothetical protein